MSSRTPRIMFLVFELWRAAVDGQIQVENVGLGISSGVTSHGPRMA
jgi:hypothetical protein